MESEVKHIWTLPDLWHFIERCRREYYGTIPSLTSLQQKIRNEEWILRLHGQQLQGSARILGVHEDSYGLIEISMGCGENGRLPFSGSENSSWMYIKATVPSTERERVAKLNIHDTVRFDGEINCPSRYFGPSDSHFQEFNLLNCTFAVTTSNGGINPEAGCFNALLLTIALLSFVIICIVT